MTKKYDRVICLIRASNQELAKIKLNETLKKYKIENQVNLNLVEIWLGDLEKENLGLNNEYITRFNKTVNIIFHCAALVNFMLDYDSVKQANTNSTFTLLDWCRGSIKKQFNFISTKGVFSLDDKLYYDEAESSNNQLHYLDRGYESSKWICEGLIESIRKDVSCNIFRLGRITGDSKFGTARYDDFFHRFISGCILLNAFPVDLLDKSTFLTPVDRSQIMIVTR